MGKNQSLVGQGCTLDRMLLLLRVYPYGADSANTAVYEIELMFLMNTIPYI